MWLFSGYENLSYGTTGTPLMLNDVSTTVPEAKDWPLKPKRNGFFRSHEKKLENPRNYLLHFRLREGKKCIPHALNQRLC
jgi:hypothetical protein